jgi:hypothetical protein
MHMIGHQVPLFDSALFLLRQFAEYLTQMPSQLPVQHFSSALGNKHHMVFALPLVGGENFCGSLNHHHQAHTAEAADKNKEKSDDSQYIRHQQGS